MKKTIFIVFQNIIKNEVLIHGKNTVVIDFNKTKKIELKCNTWKKDKFCCLNKATKIEVFYMEK